jgi:hypothetical protein
VASIGLKLLNGAGLATALVFGKNLIGDVLAADSGSAAPGIGAVAPQLALVVGIVAALGLVTAAGREVREILSETTARHAKQAVIDVARRVELSAYETPAFHDRLVRAASGEHRPIQMVDGLIGSIGAAAWSWLDTVCRPDLPPGRRARSGRRRDTPGAAVAADPEAGGTGARRRRGRVGRRRRRPPVRGEASPSRRRPAGRSGRSG